jgi:hypothetical protein
MAEITYESIKPLIAKEQVQGSTMHCTFRCPVTGFSVEASAHISTERNVARDVADDVKRHVKSDILWQVRSGISNAVRRLFGGGSAGSIADSAAYTATSGMGSGGSQTTYTASEKRAAVVAAFNQVAGKFRWDDAAKRWVGAP